MAKVCVELNEREEVRETLLLKGDGRELDWMKDVKKRRKDMRWKD